MELPIVQFYLDFVSPYSWLALMQAEHFAVEHGVHWEPRPVVYAALIDAHGLIGPVETPAKRRYTFRLGRGAVLGPRPAGSIGRTSRGEDPASSRAVGEPARPSTRGGSRAVRPAPARSLTLGEIVDFSPTARTRSCGPSDR